MTKILVLGGGDSPERDVSLRSAQCVSDGLSASGIRHDLYDPIDLSALVDIAKDYDVVLPVLHGKYGEDGVVQELLEKIGVRYLGSDSKVSALCMDKQRTKQVLVSAGISVPVGTVLDHREFMDLKPRSGFVLKPVSGGSSIDTVISRDGKYAEPALRDLFRQHGTLLYEEYVEGREITVAVLGDRVLPPVLIIPPTGQTFDYKNKYNGSSREICPIPEKQLDAQIQKQACDIARSVCAALGTRHIARVDMIVRQNGDIVTLEVNTLPGLTNASLLPLAAKVEGLDMPALTKLLVNLVLMVQ
jgi:D-alanine-D-alanine ligase